MRPADNNKNNGVSYRDPGPSTDNAPTVVCVSGRSLGVCSRPPQAGCVPGGRALPRPAAVGGQVGAVRPQHREEQSSRCFLRRPEPADPSPAAAQEAHPVSEVSLPLGDMLQCEPGFYQPIAHS